MLHLDGFLSLELRILSNWNASTKCLFARAGEPQPEVELGIFEGAGALFSDVSGAGAGAGAIKIFGSSSSYPIIEKM